MNISLPLRNQGFYVHYLSIMEWGLALSLSFILTDENQQIDDDAISQTEMARCNPIPLQPRKCSI